MECIEAKEKDGDSSVKISIRQIFCKICFIGVGKTRRRFPPIHALSGWSLCDRLERDPYSRIISFSISIRRPSLEINTN